MNRLIALMMTLLLVVSTTGQASIAPLGDASWEAKTASRASKSPETPTQGFFLANRLTHQGKTDSRYDDASGSLFTGEQFDAHLNQTYLRARYYDAQVGRFTAMDSWAGSPYDPISLNKYLYTESNPVNLTDPSGHMTLGEINIGLNSAANLTTSSLRAYRLYDKATTFLDFFLGYQELRRLTASGFFTGYVKDGVQNSLNSYHGLNPDDAIDSLIRHTPTLMFLSLKEWTGYLTKNAKAIDRFVIYMPQAGVPINFEIPILKGKVNINLAFDSKGNDRITGVGVGLRGKKPEQIWRMDYHEQHFDRNRAKDADYFHDRQFHYHVKRAPQGG